LTLLVIPTVYEILADGRDWLGTKLRRSGALATPANEQTPARTEA
jgi:hypothetical protein